MVTVPELRRMSANAVVRLIEARIGRPVPIAFSLKLAMAIGAGDQGLVVIDPSPGAGGASIEKIDWQRLADLVNGKNPPDDPQEPEPIP